MNPHSLHAMPMLLRVMAQIHTAGHPFSGVFNTTAKAVAQAHGATLEQFLDLSRRTHPLVIPALALDHHSAHTRVKAHQVAAPVRAWAAAHGLDG